MTVNILRVGAPALRKVSAEVANIDDPVVVREAAALGEAIRAFRAEHGFGRAIAAPQIGIAKRMIGLAMPGWPDVIVNPQVVWTSDERMTLWDDCMCFPEMLVRVERFASISVRFTDMAGKTHLKEALDRPESELMQHEIDHLDGKLSFDRAVGENAFVHRSVFEMNRPAFADEVDHFPQSL